MPPIDYKKYAPNWKYEIRPAILLRANNCCEVCGVANYAYGYRDDDGKFYDYKFIEDELELRGNDMFDNVLSSCFDKKGNPTKGIKIVLTIAHLDHDEHNHNVSLDRLKAMCQRCHLRYDVDEKKRRRRNKYVDLFNNNFDL